MNVFGLTAKYFMAVFDLTLYTPNLNADVRKIYILSDLHGITF